MAGRVHMFQGNKDADGRACCHALFILAKYDICQQQHVSCRLAIQQRDCAVLVAAFVTASLSRAFLAGDGNMTDR